ncbi:MAG: SlyX family protein [Gammaproteobacteria bacterium]|nr:MAG: SlyX family protein [Gammaproteobacteria bacterium]
MMDNAMQENLIDLQTRLTFQEETLLSLSDTVAQQQQALDDLLHAVNELKSQLKELTPSMIATVQEEPMPPHY